jgi:hypothetical protein
MTGMEPAQPTPSVESRDDIAARFLQAGYLRLSRNGQWFLPDGEITHPKLRLFLFKHLQQNREGDYWIVNGPQRVLVEVADAPFFVVGAARQGDTILLDLCDQRQELLQPGRLYIGGDHAFYTRVKVGQNGDSNGEGHWARFSRAACSQLADWLVERDGGYALRLGAADYTITSVPRPDRAG